MEATSKQEKTRTRANFGRSGWLVVIMCLLGLFMATAGTGSVNISSTYFTQTYGWSMTMIMLPITLGTVCATVLMIFGGRRIVINRSPTRVIFVLSLIWTACYLLNGASRNMAWFYITIIGCSVCGYLWGTICGPSLMSNWFPTKTGLAMGFATIGMAIGPGVTQFIMRPIYQNVGRLFPAYIPLAIVAIVIGILNLTVVKDFPSEAGAYPDNDPTLDLEKVKAQEEEIEKMRKENEKSLWTVRRILSTRDFWFIWVSIAMLGFCAGFQGQIVTTLMSYGMSMTLASYSTLFVAIVAAVGSWLVGKVDARFGTKTAMIVGCCMCFGMAIFAQFNNLPCKVIAFVFVAIAMGGTTNFMLASLMKCWGQLNCMIVYRFTQPLVSLCSGVSATLLAWIAGLFGGNYNMAFLIIGCLGVIALILILMIKPERVHEKEKRFLAEAGKSPSQAE